MWSRIFASIEGQLEIGPVRRRKSVLWFKVIEGCSQESKRERNKFEELIRFKTKGLKLDGKDLSFWLDLILMSELSKIIWFVINLSHKAYLSIHQWYQDPNYQILYLAWISYWTRFESENWYVRVHFDLKSWLFQTSFEKLRNCCEKPSRS